MYNVREITDNLYWVGQMTTGPTCSKTYILYHRG